MYKGNNIINLNQACIIEAVQMYLDSKFKEGMSPLSIWRAGLKHTINLEDLKKAQLSD